MNKKEILKHDDEIAKSWREATPQAKARLKEGYNLTREGESVEDYGHNPEPPYPEPEEVQQKEEGGKYNIRPENDNPERDYIEDNINAIKYLGNY